MSRPVHKLGAEGDKATSRVELILSILLRAGVLASMSIILLGIAVIFIHHPADLTDSANLPQHIGPGAEFPHTVGQIAQHLVSFSGAGSSPWGFWC